MTALFLHLWEWTTKSRKIGGGRDGRLELRRAIDFSGFSSSLQWKLHHFNVNLFWWVTQTVKTSDVRSWNTEKQPDFRHNLPLSHLFLDCVFPLSCLYGNWGLVTVDVLIGPRLIVHIQNKSRKALKLMSRQLTFGKHCFIFNWGERIELNGGNVISNFFHVAFVLHEEKAVELINFITVWTSGFKISKNLSTVSWLTFFSGFEFGFHLLLFAVMETECRSFDFSRLYPWTFDCRLFIQKKKKNQKKTIDWVTTFQLLALMSGEVKLN